MLLVTVYRPFTIGGATGFEIHSNRSLASFSVDLHWRTRICQLADMASAFYIVSMLTPELAQAALTLPVEDRLELVRRLIESVVAPAPVADAVAEGIQRIEEVASGKITGLTEEDFRATLS